MHTTFANIEFEWDKFFQTEDVRKLVEFLHNFYANDDFLKEEYLNLN